MQNFCVFDWILDTYIIYSDCNKKDLCTRYIFLLWNHVEYSKFIN